MQNRNGSDLMLCYCKRCGRIVLFLFDKDKKLCDYCNNIVSPIPEQFLSSEYSINEDSKESFINEYIKTSPEFDQYLFDSREKNVMQHADDFEKYNLALAHGKAVLEGRDKGNSYGVTCPYCHATNVRKISMTSKAVHTTLFGIFSMSRNGKQWHCNNCNSDF